MIKRLLQLSILVILVSQPVLAQSRSEIPINCTLKPLKTIKLSSEIPGIVKEVLVSPGAKVSKGDVILRLDTDLLRSDLELAKKRANFDSLLKAAKGRQRTLKDRLNRLKHALAQKAVSRSEFDEVFREHEVAIVDGYVQQQELNIAATNKTRAALMLAKATIRSPEDGIIGEELANVGEAVIGEPVATIFVIKKLRAEAFVPLQFLELFRKQSKHHIVVGGDADNPVEVQLDYVSPVANLASKTISIFFLVDSENLISGNSCLLKIG